MCEKEREREREGKRDNTPVEADLMHKTKR